MTLWVGLNWLMVDLLANASSKLLLACLLACLPRGTRATQCLGV
jgi:hypothetical protein